MKQKIELSENKNGFTERDMYSKAILNTDPESLLKYKIQRNRYKMLSIRNSEIENLKNEYQSLKEEIGEIKTLLLQIAAGKK